MTENSGGAGTVEEPGSIILVVDDNPGNRHMLARRLERNGYRTAVACDGEEALQIVDSVHPDIVLMDFMMPRLDGLGALRILRRTKSASELPVIMVTAKTDEDCIVECLDAGANDYIAKPVKMPIALARIASQLDRTSALHDLAATNAELENRIAARTRALGETNHRLQEEIEIRKGVEATMRQTQFDLEDANAAKTSFLITMSHELRTPLNAVIGFSEIISKQSMGPVTPVIYAEYAEDIRRSGVHLLETINNILDITRIDNGRVDINETTIALKYLLRECGRVAADKTAQTGIRLRIVEPPEDWALRCDERRMVQAIINLLDNAFKFTSGDGSVTLSCARSGEGGLAISVRDTGCGFPKSGIQKALEPFSQVDSRLDRSHEGIGLGLPLVVSIAKMHEGTLSLESDPGEGVCASLVFPACRFSTRKPESGLSA